MTASDTVISTDKDLLDIGYIHQFLTTTYWAKGIPRAAVEKSIRNAFCFGVYQGGQQVGFARVITDFTTFAYIGDVFIDAGQRGRGLGKQLIAAIVGHEALQGLRRWHLLTENAHGLYRRFGFVTPEEPFRHMERRLTPDYSSL